MSDNPFADPGEPDGTVIVPKKIVRTAVDPASTQAEGGGDGERFADLRQVGESPILSAAAPLLSLLAGLRNMATVPDPAKLRDLTIVEVRRYEQALRDARVPLERIRTGHYALCASIDDVVQNTPWGSRGPWADASLVSTFHREVRSGERFFDLLTRLCQTPGKYLPVIELMYRCMSLGMQGRYRLSARGPAELDRVREETFLVILRQRGAAEPSLSLHWQGVSARYVPHRRVLPVWLAALSALGALALAYGLLSLGLNGDSDRTFAAGLALPPLTMPAIARAAPPVPLAPAPPPPPGARTALAAALQQEIRDGLVSIAGTDAAPIIRVQSAGMFASGSASLQPRFRPTLARIAAALQARPGPVQIIGYTDNQPIRTVAFPSNYQLSLARAQAAADVLAGTIGRDRIRVEGRADADPIASNATSEGRQQNRRIEIVATQEGHQP